MKWGNPLNALRAFFEILLDQVFPPKARSTRTKRRHAEQIPLQPEVHMLLGEQIVTIMDYRNRIVEDLIRSIKYDGAQYGAHLCAQILAEYLTEEIATIRAFSTKSILLIPVALHPSRQKERGYNQIIRVLNELPEEFKNGDLSKLAPEILLRVRPTPQQTRLSRPERIKNVAGAFALSEGVDLKRMHVFLIDDVTTTGATLVSAATPLTRAGAEVTLLALARA